MRIITNEYVNQKACLWRVRVKWRVNQVTQGEYMESLAEALPEEQKRVREILGHCKEVGPAGLFGVAMIEKSLEMADKAVMSGDVTQMIVAYNDLKEISG